MSAAIPALLVLASVYPTRWNPRRSISTRRAWCSLSAVWGWTKKPL